MGSAKSQVTPRHLPRLLLTALIACGCSADVYAAPYAWQDIDETPMATTIVLDVLANDLAGEFPLDPFSIVIESGPYCGAAIATGGKITYTPNPGYHGWDDITYRVRDTQGNLSNDQWAWVLVLSPYAAPARADEAYAYLNEIVYIRVVENDGDLITPIDPTTAVNLTVNHGYALSDYDGGMYYYPPPGFSGDDWFTYQVWDINGNASNIGYVTVHVVGNKPPKIIAFDVFAEGNNTWFFSGVIEDENLWGMQVIFGGILEGHTSIVTEDGVFSATVVILPGYGGIATAQTTPDELGQPSNVRECYCDR